MVVYDEHLTFVLFFIEKIELLSIFYFDPGVIWGRFSYRKPIFSIETSKFYENIKNKQLTSKSILLSKIDLPINMFFQLFIKF